MAWSYSGNPGESRKDEVRFLVGDTNEADPLLQDDEIAYLLAQAGDLALPAAVEACEAIAAKFAKEADFSSGATSVTASQRREHYRQQAATLRSKRASSSLPGFRFGPSPGPRFRRDDDVNRRS